MLISIASNCSKQKSARYEIAIRLMTTEVIPMGTSAATPTRDRALSATALQRGGRILLFDCGEGTQFRLMEAGLNRNRIDAVFITHLHGDHFFGLPGLLTSLSLNHRRDPMTIVGPRGLGSLLQMIPGLGEHEVSFPIEFKEFEPGFGKMTALDTPDFEVVARPLLHRVPVAGYRFQERPRAGNLDVEKARAKGVTHYRHFRDLKAGRDVELDNGTTVRSRDVVGPERAGASFAYLFDTRPCASGIELARDANIVFHDATFASADVEHAVRTGHSTATEAAGVALEARAQRLLLGHFSARYSSVDVLVNEARRVFKNTEAADELKRYAIEAAE